MKTALILLALSCASILAAETNAVRVITTSSTNSSGNISIKEGVTRAGQTNFAAPPKVTERQAEPYVYVSGEVHQPGRYGWTKGMTLIDAIQAAGGFTDIARHRFSIFHLDGSSEVYTREGKNAPPILKAGDRIPVPKMIF